MTPEDVFGWLTIVCVCAFMALGMGSLTGIGVAYRYEVDGDTLIVRGLVFGRWIFWRKRVPLSSIVEMRPFDAVKDLWPGGWMWGVTLRPWWTLVMRKRVNGFRKVFVTPRPTEATKVREALRELNSNSSLHIARNEGGA